MRKISLLLLTALTALQAQEKFTLQSLPVRRHHLTIAKYKDQVNAFAGGEQGAFFVPDNYGGLMYRPLPTQAAITRIHFSGEHGFVLAEDSTTATSWDGGKTWTYGKGRGETDECTKPFGHEFGVFKSAEKSFTVRVSVDGGSDWTTQFSCARCRLDDISFNDSLGAVTGTEYDSASSSATGVVLTTTDDGATWTPSRVPGTMEPRNPQFFGLYRGFVTELNKIFYTRDGGKNWSSHDFSAGGWTFRDYKFVDAMRGYAIRSRLSPDTVSQILKSTDGGANWSVDHEYRKCQLMSVDAQSPAWEGPGDGIFAVALGLVGDSLQTSVTFSRSIYLDWATEGTPADNVPPYEAVDFADPQHGIVVGTEGRILATSDQGIHWAIANHDAAANLNAVKLADARSAWAAGDQGTLLRTADGGATWTETGTGTRLSLRSIAIDPSGDGYAVGDSGIILLLPKDRGPVAKSFPTGRASNLLSVSAPAPGIAYVTGDSGLSWKTSDGGRSWSRMNPGAHGRSLLQFMTSTDGFLLKQSEMVPIGHGGWENTSAELFSSHDGGETWTVVDSAIDMSSSPGQSPPSPRKLLFTGKTGYGIMDHSLLKSIDGGSSWMDGKMPADAFKTMGANMDMALSDSNTLWVLGETGIMRVDLMKGPNPVLGSFSFAATRFADGRLSFSLDHAARIDAALFDARGRTLWARGGRIEAAGAHILEVPFDHMAPGKMILKLNRDGRSESWLVTR